MKKIIPKGAKLYFFDEKGNFDKYINEYVGDVPTWSVFSCIARTTDKAVYKFFKTIDCCKCSCCDVVEDESRKLICLECKKLLFTQLN